MSRKAVVFSP